MMLPPVFTICGRVDGGWIIEAPPTDHIRGPLHVFISDEMFHKMVACSALDNRIRQRVDTLLEQALNSVNSSTRSVDG